MLRQLVDGQVLGLPEGHHLPGKIHSRIALGSDGRLYFSTHRGSTSATTDQNHYQGDWILRVRPGDRQGRGRRPGPGPEALHPQRPCSTPTA